MAKNSFLRKLGSTMYGAAEGILDAGTFGLSDNLTDTLWTDVVNKGGANNLNQFRGAGNMAGAVGAGFLTGNISGSIEEGLEGFGYLAANSQNEQFQKAEKFANMAAQLSGFAGGANNLTGIGTKMYGLASNPVVSQPVNQVSSLLSSIPKMPSTNVPKDVVYGNRQSTNYADGGPIKPTKKPGVLTKADLEFINRNADIFCPQGDCLKTTRQAFDKVTANLSGMPSTYTAWNNMGITSTLHQPTEEEVATQPWFRGDDKYGSADSWDIHGAIMRGGGTNFYNVLKDPKNKLNQVSANLPIGTMIGWGNESRSHNYEGYNKDFGLYPSNHSTLVVAHNEEGKPILYDGHLGKYGTLDELQPILKNKLGYHVQNVSAAKDYIEAAKNLRLQTQNPNVFQPIEAPTELKLNIDNVLKSKNQSWAKIGDREPEFNSEYAKKFATTLETNKERLMASLGLDNKSYDDLAKLALSIAAQESELGGALDSYLEKAADKLGETQGMTQLNFSNLNDERLKYAKQFSYGNNSRKIDSETDLRTPEGSALATMMYLSKLKPDAERWYQKGLQPGVREFVQPEKDFVNTTVKDALRTNNSRINVDGFNLVEINKTIPFSDLEDMTDAQASYYLNHRAGQKDKYTVKRGEDGRYRISMKTSGNNPNLTDVQKIAYAWQSPTSLSTGDAEGMSLYAQRIQNYYNTLNSLPASEIAKPEIKMDSGLPPEVITMGKEKYQEASNFNDAKNQLDAKALQKIQAVKLKKSLENYTPPKPVQPKAMTRSEALNLMYRNSRINLPDATAINNYADGGPIKPRLSSVFIPAMNPQQFQTMLNSSQPRALTKEEMLARVNRPQQNAQESTRNVSPKLVTPEQRAEAFYNSEAEQRKRRLADAEAANKEDLITSDNWQQLLMRQSQATGDKFHSDYIPDWLNPLVGIGDMASGLGAAPYNIQQGNYGSAALGVASPLAVGALGSFGANTTGQFLGNVFNPIPISTPQALNAVKNAAIKTGQLTKTAVQNLPRNLEAVERNITINLLNSKPAIAARNRVINKLINETKVKGSIFDKKNLELLKKYNTIEGLEGRIKGYVPTVLDLQHTSPGQGKLRDYLRRRYSNADNLDRPSNFEFTSTDNKFHANTVRFPTEDTPGEFSGYTFGSAMVKPDRVAAGKTAKLLIDLAENAPGAWRFNPGSLSGDSFTLWSNILKKRQDLNKFGVDVYGLTNLNTWGVDSKLAQAFYKARNTRDVNDINAVNDIVIDLTNPVLSKYNVPNSSDIIKELNEITKSGDIGTYPSMSLIKRYMQGGMIKRADGSYSRRGLWDNIRANRGSGKKPTKQMLEQERKIKAKK